MVEREIPYVPSITADLTTSSDHLKEECLSPKASCSYWIAPNARLFVPIPVVGFLPSSSFLDVWRCGSSALEGQADQTLFAVVQVVASSRDSYPVGNVGAAGASPHRPPKRQPAALASVMLGANSGYMVGDLGEGLKARESWKWCGQSGLNRRLEG